MANEINYSVNFGASKGGAAVANSGNKTLDMAGTEMTAQVQNFAMAGSAVSLGGVDEAEVLTIKNLDPTNNLIVGLTNGTPPTNVLSVIKPGGIILLTGVSTSIFAGASASTVDAFVAVCET